MQTTRFFLTGISALAFGAAACSPAPADPVAEAPPPAAAAPMADMPASPAPVAGPITGVGKVVEIAAGTNTIKLDHEAISALNWPSMSMAFTVSDPALVTGLAVGDTVSFELKNAAESTVITKIQKQ
ncbi:MAG: copper-binding protein [Alphaproteobacteria bacterium]|nr:copper-binding protein [Alphaproteobacteria bacterium]